MVGCRKLLFYLDNYGKEEFMNVNRLSDSKYITKQEMDNLQRKKKIKNKKYQIVLQVY